MIPRSLRAVQGVETLITASHQASRDSTILLTASWKKIGVRKAHEKPDEDPGPLLAEEASLAQHSLSAPVGGLCDRNVAFICNADGSVTRVTSRHPHTAPPALAAAAGKPPVRGMHPT